MALFQFQCRQTRKLRLQRKTEKCVDNHRLSMATDLQMTCCKLVCNLALTVDTSVSHCMMHCRLPHVRLSILDSCSTVRQKMIYDILLTAIGFVTRWQQYSTHLHTNSTQNDTKQTIHRTTQQFGRVRAVPRLGELYPGICLTTEGKSRKNLSQGSRV